MRMKRQASLLLIAALLAAGQVFTYQVQSPQPARAAAPSKPDITDRPDVVSAQLTARLEGHRVHVQDLDNATDTIYANSNGTFTTETTAGPIRTRGSNGWVPIDTHLVPDRGAYRAAAADGAAAISAGGAGDIASATSGTAQIGIGFGSSLPTPTVSGATAVYTNALPGVNVVASAVEGGFDIQLILKSRPTGPLVFNLPLHVSGLTVTQDSNGVLHYRDATLHEIFTTSAPLMYGIGTDPHSGLPTRSGSVTSVLVSSANGLTLQVTPDASFLADPSVTYPVTIDPSTTINRSNYGFDQYTGGNFYNNTIYEDGVTGILRVGIPDCCHPARGFYSFDNTSFAGKYVQSATFTAYEHWSWSCSARVVYVYDLSTNYTTSSTWASPPTELGSVASANVAKGYNANCPAGNVSFTGTGMTGMAQRWSGLSSGLHSLELRAASETDNYYWKEFSGNSSTSKATLSVTYDSYPNTATNLATSPATTCTTGSGRPYMSTTTPTLQATVSDPDGGTLYGAFEIWTLAGTQIGGQNLSASVASGSTASWMVTSGSFANGNSYKWRVRGYDGTVYSQSYSSPFCEFTIDTTVDSAPTISSSTYPQDAWSSTSGASNNFSWVDTSGGDANGWQYQEDGGGWSATQPLASKSLTWNPTAVQIHELDVRAVNKAGVLGNAAQYLFGIGQGALVTPADQDRTQASVALSSSAATIYPWADYFWRQSSSGSFTQVPSGDVTLPGTTTNPTWPVASDGNGNFTALNWNLANSVRAAGKGDGAVAVEVCFYATQTQSLSSPSVCAPIHNVQLASHAFGATYATSGAGPGTVSLLTGDYQMSASDASVPSATGSLSVGRSITTSDPTGEVGNTLSANLHDAEPPLTGWSAPYQATASTAASPTVLGADSLQLSPASGTCSSGCNETYEPVGGDAGALRLGLQPGSTYTFTVREYVPAGTGLTTDYAARGERPVFIYQIGTQGYHEIDGTAPRATDSWQLVFVTFTVPDGATEAFIRLYNGFNVGKTSDAVYYDDLTLVKDSVYGAGWRPDLPGPPAGDADLTITDHTSQGFVVLTAPDGGETVYTVVGSATCCPINYTGLNDANDGTVLSKTAANTFTMTDPDGTVTTWQSSDGGNTWRVQSVAEPGSSTTTSYTFDSDGRVIQVVGPAPLGLSCSAPLTTPGCRTLTLTYTATTAAPPSGSSWSDYPGLLKSINFTAADPANSNAMTTVTISAFAYDSNGFLRQAWDPRLYIPLKTTYGYGSDLRINSVTPPGLNAWSLTYDAPGRLSQVSRPDPAGGTDTTTFVYNVPFTAAGAPIEMGAATTSSWGETSDLPNYAAAVFGPDHPMPAGTTASSVSSSDWPYATIDYLDVNGREVNTAAYGAGAWQITTTSYDKWGNVLTQLSALARDEALSPSSYPDLDGYVANQPSSGNRAALLSTTKTYSSDGTELIDTLGPMHPVLLTTGGTVDARVHVHKTYDEGAPSGGPYRLETAITTAAQTPDGVDHDVLTSHKAYDPSVAGDASGWTLREPITETTVMGSGTPDIVSVTRYDAQGRVIESRTPANTSGGDAHSTLNTYYTASGTGACVNPAQAGMLCQTSPAAQPTSGLPNLVTSTTTYNMWGEVASVSETNGTGTRTTTTVYDAAQRLCISTVTTSGVGDTALPSVYTAYDPNTGLITLSGNISGSTPATCPATAPSLSASLQTGYDSDGRAISYVDASGNTSTFTYTTDGLIATANDGKGSVTYTYDGGTGEHRRRVTSLADSQAGTFTAIYSADGVTASETFPNGLTATKHFDDNGQATSLTYVMGSATWLSFTAAYGANGQVLSGTSNGSRQTFTYDNAGRLTQVADTDQTVTPVSCTTRVYAYDADSNRLSLTAYPADAQGSCSTATTPNVSSHSYDQADRISNSGYTYDQLGRTMTVAGIDAGGTTLTTGYYINDMVASQSQGAASKSFGLDPSGRITTITTGTSIQTNRYASGADNPAWIGVSDGTWTRNVDDIAGNLAAIVSSTGSDELQLVNLHGDVVATAPNSSGASGPDAYFESTEFGVPRTSNTGTPRYAWLGGKDRDSADALAGIVLMGRRLYSPALGRFLQVDPVPGGSANSYDYCSADPVNCADLNGTDFWGGLQNAMVSIGRAMPSSARHVYASAVAGTGTWAGQEHADLTSGDPLRVAGASLQVVWVVSTVIPGPGMGAGTVAKLGARFAARNLAEKLALQAAKSGAGRRIMQGAIRDWTKPGWLYAKMAYSHYIPGTVREHIEIHYWRNLWTGRRFGFKFKD
jgi:RHS repeat-associated protein